MMRLASAKSLPRLFLGRRDVAVVHYVSAFAGAPGDDLPIELVVLDIDRGREHLCPCRDCSTGNIGDTALPCIRRRRLDLLDPWPALLGVDEVSEFRGDVLRLEIDGHHLRPTQDRRVQRVEMEAPSL